MIILYLKNERHKQVLQAA